MPAQPAQAERRTTNPATLRSVMRAAGLWTGMGAAMVMAGAAGAPAQWAAETDEWHKKRVASLTSETGWLTLAGLHWLVEGAQAAGSAADNAVVLVDRAPAHLGVFTRTGNTVAFEPAKGTPVTDDAGKPVVGRTPMVVDSAGKPTTLRSGTFSFFIIQRGDKVGIRLRDAQATTRTGFAGIERFPFNASWRVEARWEPFATPQKMKVPNVLGAVEDMDSPGVAVFTVDGKEARLQPVIEPGDDELFFIFADATNRTDTYGAGRFFYAPLPKGNTVTLDFNRAYNPPCAFTSFATCPIPPPQNRLSMRVEAGEKRYGKGH